MKNARRRWLWFISSAIVLGLILYNLSRGGEWRNFRWDRVWLSLVRARPGDLLAAVAITYMSYILRAYRWGFFLNPFKKASFRVLFVGQVLGFSSIYLLGRAGEIVRPAYIAKKENIPPSVMAAVWLLERIYDTLFIAAIFSAAVFWGPLKSPARQAAGYSGLRGVGMGVLFASVAIIIFLVLLRLRTESLKAKLGRLFGLLSAGRRHRLEGFLTTFAEGLGVIRSWNDLLASIASTMLLWIINITFFWLVLHSMPGAAGQLSWMAAAMVLVSAILGMLVQLPGIGGGFQVVVIKGLTDLFRVHPEDATGASLLLWTMLIMPCVTLGLVLVVLEGLTFRKLEKIAKEGRTVLEHKL
jgi:uncharacterized protein (TIRG00374 family)